MRRLLLAAALLVGSTLPAHAQLTVPYSFTAGTVASPDEVNANFAKFTDALNRTGGTMTGTLTSRAITPSANNTYDLGASGTRFATIYSVLGNFSGTLTTAALAASANNTYDIGASGTRYANVYSVLGNFSSTVTAASVSSVNFAVSSTSAGTTGPLVYNASNVLTFVGGSSGFGWNANNNGSTLATLSNAGIWSVTGFGSHSFTSTGTGANILTVRNSTAGTGNYGALLIGNDQSAQAGGLDAFSSTYTTAGPNIADGVKLFSEQSAGLNLAAQHASGVIRFYTGGTTLRYGINAAGDFTTGTSSAIWKSTGTPTFSSGGGSGGTLTGTDSAFMITPGTGFSATIVINFGHTWTNVPVCVANVTDSARVAVASVNSTSQVTIKNTAIGTDFMYVICEGK